VIEKGECVADDHELVGRYPDSFESDGDHNRRREIRSAVRDPRNCEAGASFGPSREDRASQPAADGIRSEALRANEGADFLPDASRAHMERMIREDTDPDERLSRFVTVTSDRAYFRAFSAWINDTVSGGHSWTDAERLAVQRVQQLQRGLTLGTGSAGGFLVPFELDPPVVIASTGYVDPMRAVARVETTAFNEKRFVTSTCVSTNWYAEEVEVTDNAPALLQPTITCKKAMSFVPVSFELFEDSSIAQQIGALFADSKAAEEARVFSVGTGTSEPRGVITAVSAVAGSVIATGTNARAQGDLYANQAALPARWRPNAKWMMNLSILNGYRQLPQASGLNYSVVNDAGPEPTALGWTVHENSNMDGTLTAAAADYTVLSGDFKQYAIVDRIGSTIEVVPQLFGPVGRRPTGQKGFLLHFRVGADVLVGDAFRLTNHSG